jgi:hypothetical protein
MVYLLFVIFARDIELTFVENVDGILNLPFLPFPFSFPSVAYSVCQLLGVLIPAEVGNVPHS